MKLVSEMTEEEFEQYIDNYYAEKRKQYNKIELTEEQKDRIIKGAWEKYYKYLEKRKKIRNTVIIISSILILSAIILAVVVKYK